MGRRAGRAWPRRGRRACLATVAPLGLWLGAIGCTGAVGTSRAESAKAVGPGTTQVRTAAAHALPALDGSRLHLTVLEVTYRPGGASGPHRHPCPVVGYVVRGAVRMQVGGAPEVVYRAGDTFYEEPNATHIVSANAGRTEPVTFLATFVCDQETRLSVPVIGARDTSDHRP